MIFGPELISTALQRGAYTAANTKMAARVLFAYSPGMFFAGSYNLFQRSYYARGNYRTPLYTAGGVVVLDIILSLPFLHIGMDVSSLAWANTAAFALGSLVLNGRISERVVFL